jgi:aquaporin Z
MKKQYIVEAIGAFFLVMVVALTGNPLAIGAVLIALVYMGGYISGAHYNPAVTLGIYLLRKIEKKEAQTYVLAQMLGGLVAAVVVAFITGKPFIPGPSVSSTFASSLLVEILFTFLLASVVYHVAVSDKQKDKEFYGLAIGLTVMAAAFAGGPISGGAYNPAVGVAPLLLDLPRIASYVPQLILYTAGPLIGSSLAAWVYRLK